MCPFVEDILMWWSFGCCHFYHVPCVLFMECSVCTCDLFTFSFHVVLNSIICLQFKVHVKRWFVALHELVLFDPTPS